MKRAKPEIWSDEDNAVLRRVYLKGGPGAVIPLLSKPRTIKAVCERALRMGLTRPTEWGESEKAIVLKHYTLKGSSYCAALLPGRTPLSVRSMARVLGVQFIRKGVKYSKPKAKQKPEKVVKLLKSAPAQKPRNGLVGEPIITSDTKVTIAPPFVDRRWLADRVERVVDSLGCREWARRI